MRKTTLILAIFLNISFLSCTKTEKADIAIQNVTVIDATGASARSGMTVLITGNRIFKISKTQKTKLTGDTKVVDGSGKFLIPGLWDMHIHPYDEEDIRWKEFMALFITNGITNVRVMFGNLELHQWREEISSYKLIGPRMIIASPRPSGISSVEEGRHFVRRSKSEGADFIKILSDDLPRDVYFAIADEANKQGLPFAGHVPYSVSAVEASDAGQLSLEHKYSVSIPCSELEEEIRTRFMKITPTFRSRTKEYADLDYNEQKAKDLFTRLVANGTFVCPTLVVWNEPAFRDKAELANDPRLAYYPSEVRNWFKNMGKNLIDDEVVADLRKLCSKSHFIVGAMNKAGVKILSGTDSGSVPFVFQGFSLHDELKLLVESGLTPMEALQSATINAAECVGRLDSLGTIEEGKIADLILLEENPLSSIENTKKINSVFYNGKYLDRPKLNKILDNLRRLAQEM